MLGKDSPIDLDRAMCKNTKHVLCREGILQLGFKEKGT